MNFKPTLHQPAQELAKKKELEQFEKTENGTDCQVSSMPVRAQEIALEAIAQVLASDARNKACELTMLLDTDLDFRHELGYKDDEQYVKEIDACQRLLRFKMDGKQVLV